MEWKPPLLLRRGAGAASLETFLSGMETGTGAADGGHRGDPLKPSLVEWKQREPPPSARARVCLETFLSGMETGL